MKRHNAVMMTLFGLSLFASGTNPGIQIKSLEPSINVSIATSTNPQEPESATICQIINDPGNYNHRLLRISGFFSDGFEDSALFDPTCDSRFSLWFEYGGTQSTGTMYCCGVTPKRQRAEQVSVEGIPIPLVVDEEFRRFDGLLHGAADSLVHATVVGRFFAGEKTKLPSGVEKWIGYGHMGMASLLIIQQVIRTDPHDRTDLDYRASPDQPSLESKRCSGYRYLTELDPFNRQLEMQKQAESGERAWLFDDPDRVAIDVLESLTKRPRETLKNVQLSRQTQGRMIYEWRPPNEQKRLMVVLSRPYALSFYSRGKAIAWVPAAAYESTCR